MKKQPSKTELRALYEGTEDIMELRIKHGQRLVAIFKERLGVEPGEDEKAISNVVEALVAEYKTITDGVLQLNNRDAKKLILKSDSKLIDSHTELLMISEYERLREHENDNVKRMGDLLKTFPIWNEFLYYVAGCGPKMGTALISLLDLSKAPYPSSFWKYCGLDVVYNPETGANEGRSRKKAFMVQKEIINRDGEKVHFQGLTYSPEAKKKFVFVLGECLIKQGKGYYRNECYLPYKERLANHSVHSQKKPAHRHAMARRYMVKQFLVDLHCAWSVLETGSESPRYNEDKLNRPHHRRSFNECLEFAKLNGGKPEDYCGPKNFFSAS